MLVEYENRKIVLKWKISSFQASRFAGPMPWPKLSNESMSRAFSPREDVS